jgi:hypothetical protein
MDGVTNPSLIVAWEQVNLVLDHVDPEVALRLRQDHTAFIQRVQRAYDHYQRPAIKEGET